MSVTGNLHKLIGWAGHSKVAYLAAAGIETADMVVDGLGKPDHALRIDCNAIGIEFLDAFLSRKRKLLYLSRVWVQFAQRVGVEFGKPDIPLGIKRDIVGRTGQ